MVHSESSEMGVREDARSEVVVFDSPWTDDRPHQPIRIQPGYLLEQRLVDEDLSDVPPPGAGAQLLAGPADAGPVGGDRPSDPNDQTRGHNQSGREYSAVAS